MPRKRKETAQDLLRTLAVGFRTAALRPNIHGYRPMPKQLDFHSSNSRGRAFFGGNRSGKTVGGATEAIWWLTGKHPYLQTPEPPVRGRAVAVDFINGVEKIVRPEVTRWLPLSELRGGSWNSGYSKELRTLTLENGSTLEFMSYDQDLDKFAGTSRHFIWFDEEPPRSVYQECLARLIDTGGRWWMTMTPVEGMTWVYDEIYIKAKSDPNFFVVEVEMGENTYLNEAEIDAFLSTLDEDERKARSQGKFVQIGGLIYKHFGQQHILEPHLPDPKQLHFAMMDHGFNNPTAWLWGSIDRDSRIVIYDEHYESGQIVSYHAQKVHQLNRDHGRAPDYNVGDPSIRNRDPITGTSVQLEYQDYDISIIPGNNDVAAGIARVADLLKGKRDIPQLYVTRNCVNLIYELSRYRWGQWATSRMRDNRNVKEEPHKKDDHAADALRYGIASRPQVEDGQTVPELFIPVGATTSVEPNNRIDTDLAQIGPRRRSLDFHMGEDF